MTTEQANRLLCESLEPMPKEFPTRWTLQSPLGFWDSVRPGNPPIYCIKWFPVNFLTDESASARLLEAMLEDLMSHGRYGDGLSFGDAMRQIIREIEKFRPSYYTLKQMNWMTSVFLAALAWKGIERPDSL